AQGQGLGRLASQLSRVLQGKDSPLYHPSKDGGQHVVVVNAQGVALTGKKARHKVYRCGGGDSSPVPHLQRKQEESNRRPLPWNVCVCLFVCLGGSAVGIQGTLVD